MSNLAATVVEQGGELKTLGKGILQAPGDILSGASQLEAHLDPFQSLMPKHRAWTDLKTRQREQAFQADPDVRAHPTVAEVGRGIGDIATTAPLGMIGGPTALLPRLGTAALTAGGAAAFNPVTNVGPPALSELVTGKSLPKDDFWTEKAKQIGWGTVGGLAGEAAFSTVGRAIAPKVSSDVRELAQAGVQMTPGQLGKGGGRFGAFVRGTEEKLKALPVLGDFIRAGERRSIEDFNRAVINQALEPIGVSVPVGTKMGRDAVGFAHDAVDDAYNQLLPGLSFRADQTFMGDIQNLRQLAQGLGPQQGTFDSILRNYLLTKMPTGTMDGITLKQVDADLGHFAREYRSSGVASERLLGNAVRQLKEELRDALERQNPQAATQLRNVDAAFAMTARVEGAANQRAASQGVFRPIDLLQSIRRQDPSRRKSSFARGDALMQSFAEVGQRVLPGTIPDSGTPERAALLFVLAKGFQSFGTGAAAHAAGADLMAAGAAAAAAPLFADPARRAAQRYIVGGPRRSAVGQTVSGISSYVDPGLGIITGRTGTR